MRCREVRAAIVGGRALSTPALQRHLESCHRCRTLAAEFSRLAGAFAGATEEPTQAELDFLLRRVESAIARERGLGAWLRSLPTGWRIVLASSAAAAMAIALGVASPRVDLDAYPATRMLLSVGVFAVLLGALIAQNLRPLQRPEPSSAPLFALIALVVPFSIALLPEVKLFHPVVFHDAHDCLLLGSICGAALMALLRGLDRSATDARSLFVPAAAGGILANLALSFHCPVVSPLHLTLIHAPIGIVLLVAFKGFRSARLRIARAGVTTSEVRDER